MNKRNIKLNIVTIGILCFVFPILILTTWEIRPSISNYAYSDLNYIFVMLLTFAGSVFIFNGTQDDHTQIGNYKANSKWYNIVTGLSLIGVAITPHLDYPVFHYLCAGLFFASGATSMVIFSSPKQRWFKIIGAAIILFSLVGSFYFGYSLALAEQVALLPIALNLLGEITEKID